MYSVIFSTNILSMIGISRAEESALMVCIYKISSPMNDAKWF